MAKRSVSSRSGAPVHRLFMYLGPLKSEHRHWPPIQTFPVELVREVVDNMLKEKEDVRLDEMD